MAIHIHPRALYPHPSMDGKGSAYTVTPGTYSDKLLLSLPAGAYKADWVDPVSRSVVRTNEFSHRGGNRLLQILLTSDIALRIKRG